MKVVATQVLHTWILVHSISFAFTPVLLGRIDTMVIALEMILLFSVSSGRESETKNLGYTKSWMASIS
jgi:hypothetical protein